MNKQKETETAKVKWRSFFRFVIHGKFSWLFIVLSIIFGLLSSSILALIPDSTGKIYAGDFSMEALGGFFLLSISAFLVAACTNILTVFAKSRSTRGIRETAWKKMINLRASSAEAQSSDTLLTAITNDAKLSSNSIIEILVQVPSSVYLIAMVLSMAAGMNMKLLLVMLVLVPVYIVYGIFVGRWQHKTNYRMQLKVGRLTGYLSERLRNLDMVKAYTNEQQEEQNGKDVAGQLYKANLQSTYIASTATAYVLLTDVVATVIGIAWGSFLMKSGEINVEEWMTFFVMVPMINEQMRYLVQLWVSAKGVLGYSQRLVAIMDAPVETVKGESVGHIGTIEFDNVSFSYEKNTAISNASFTIPDGKFTAIVGSSGSGKTTLLNLAERLYLPAEGKICMDGKDIAASDIDSYRSLVTYIQQDAGIFSGSFRDAISYGVHRDVSDADIENAAKQSGIYDDIMSLPEGMNASISLWGESLSGGQKQKLVLARALLRNSDMILLDEPTRSLDREATTEMHGIIHRLFGGKTVVAVTHDMSFAMDADQIIVMNKGCVESVGTHSELMENSEFYREMIAAQQVGEAIA